MENQINHPNHYVGQVECIDAMLATFGPEMVASFCLGNWFKYNWRAGQKENNPEEQDLKKARWYFIKYKEIVNKYEINPAIV